jgi:farnesyl-diphosphate farnesyltransferase
MRGNPCFIPPMAPASNELLTDLLKDVSRSFYLTLRVLPKSIRPQIGLAYLLARTTDTVADTEIVAIEQRLRFLELLRERILGRTATVLDFGDLAKQQGSPAERILLEKVEASLSLLARCAVGDQQLIRKVLDTITSGQVLDLQRFAGASIDNIVALRTYEELDDYTYRVAGCVGEFWTKMCVQNQFRDVDFLTRQSVTEAEFLELGVRFGKGLQLVNILRDLPADLKNGRCYLPGEVLSGMGLSPANLLLPANEPKLRPLYQKLLNLSDLHLRAGWKYTNLIPRGEIRLRLACAWPILIGFKTLKLLRAGNVLDPQQRIKVSRSDVRSMILRSIVQYPLSGWTKLPERL